MRPNGAEDFREPICDREYLGMPLHTGRNSHHAPNSGSPGARNNRVEFSGEIREIEMAMTVDEHGSMIFITMPEDARAFAPVRSDYAMAWSRLSDTSVLSGASGQDSLRGKELVGTIVKKGAWALAPCAFLPAIDLQDLSSVSTKRGNTGTGEGKATPALIRFVGVSASKLRSSGPIASRSSNFDADAGTNGCARTATWRRTSAVT